MLESFSTKAVQLIDDAKNLAKEEIETTEKELIVTTYHLLLSMFLSNDTICHFLLTEEEIDFEKIINVSKSINIQETKSNIFTKEFEEIVIKASSISKEVLQEYVYDEHLFYAVLDHRNNIACKILVKLGLNLDILKKDIEDIFNFYNEDQIFCQTKKETNDLKYLINLSEVDHPHPYINRKTYINQIIYILNKKQKNNPLLIGSAGVGKTALVEGLTRVIDKNIYQLDLGGMIAGTKYRGEMEEKLLNAIEYVKKKSGILFIDEVHNIVGTGSNDGSLDAANILKPYLSRGDIKIIAATTLDEYYTYMEKDKALVRRFQNIFIDEPNINETINILKGIKYKYEQYYDTIITDDLIEYIVKKTDQLLLSRKFPDKAIDVLDETLSRNKINPSNLKTIVNSVIEGINGITIPSKDVLLNNEFYYPELQNFYLRKIYPLKITKNLGIIKVGKNFKIDLLISDLNKIFTFKDEMVLTLDLNDYQTHESLSDLIGSNKGYIGYEQGGLLYNHLLKYPISVIYLKNFNEANNSVRFFFKQLFRKKFIIDSHSRYIYMKNTLFIVEDISSIKDLGFITKQNQQNKYYDYHLKKIIKQDNLEASSYLLKKGIIIDGFKNLSEQEQVNIFYTAITKPMGKYKVKYESDKVLLEAIPS